VLALAAGRQPQDDATSRSIPPPLSLLLKAFVDSSVLAQTASLSVKVHCPNSEGAVIDSALAPTLTALSANGSNLYKVASQNCGEFYPLFGAMTLRIWSVIVAAGSQLSELMVSVRSIAISFRQSRCWSTATSSAFCTSNPQTRLFTPLAAGLTRQQPLHTSNSSSSFCNALQKMRRRPA
jgi:hypothetical protein